VEATWPDVPHQWCQSHSLRNAAQPVYERDHALKTDLRRDVRQEIRRSLSRVAAASGGGAFSPSAGHGRGRG